MLSRFADESGVTIPSGVEVCSRRPLSLHAEAARKTQTIFCAAFISENNLPRILSEKPIDDIGFMEIIDLIYR